MTTTYNRRYYTDYNTMTSDEAILIINVDIVIKAIKS